jgi:hypothetical protein
MLLLSAMPKKNTGHKYQFSRTVPGREAVGVPHGCEVPFVFGTLVRAGEWAVQRDASADFCDDAGVLDQLRENGQSQRREPTDVAQV